MKNLIVCKHTPFCIWTQFSPTPSHLHLQKAYRTQQRHSKPPPPLVMAAASAISYFDKSVPEKLPPTLDASAEQPPVFDGTTRLYTSYVCPFAQRVWITRNFKGLQIQIKLVPIALPTQNRPAWYAEKVYPENKVPSLEHNGKIIGESLDLIKYLESNFEGPSLLPEDPAEREFAEGLLSYTDEFIQIVCSSFKGDPVTEAAPAFDSLENALHRFGDGPFFLGQQFSLVDIAYIPFVERFGFFLSEQFKYDITAGRPKFAAWIEEVNKIEAYKQTKTDLDFLLEYYKKRFMVSIGTHLNMKMEF